MCIMNKDKIIRIPKNNQILIKDQLEHFNPYIS